MRASFLLVGAAAALLSACATSRPPVAPALSADTTLTHPAAAVYRAALRVAVEDRYEILASDATGGLLRLRRFHMPRRTAHVDYLTLVFDARPASTRLLVQTLATTRADDSTSAETLREDGRPHALAFLTRLGEALR